MKTSLAHLPDRKRQEIEHVAQIICKESKYVEMVILFGSFARGDWVEDVYVEDNRTYEYRSDYDIIVLTNIIKIANCYALWYEIAQKANKLPITNHVTIIAHDIEYVNKQLAKSQYFFSDIVKEGILLYDSGKLKLDQPRQCDIKQRAIDAKEDYEHWFNSATGFYSLYESSMEKVLYKHAAFNLHQATESLYATISLVFTHYRPKTHYIDMLSSIATSYDTRFLTVFPQVTDEEKEHFKILNKAYIDARYKKNYTITKEQLQYIATRVKILFQLTEKICKTKIESFA